LKDELKNEKAFTFNPIHDIKGDCGITLALLFESSEKINIFRERLKDEGIPPNSPIYSGRHVYTNWEPILNQRGAHHPGRDAFKQTKVPITYSKDMCPKTLSILERTIYLNTNTEVNRRPRELKALINAVKKAASGS
jgi:hypothetical protein